MTTEKTVIPEEFKPFINDVIRVTGIDGKSRKGKLVAVYQYSIMLETNINTKENPIEGYMLYMKHAIKGSVAKLNL